MSASQQKQLKMNEEERKKALPSPFKVLQEAMSSKTSFMLFVLNPKNMLFVIMAGLASLCTLYTTWHAGWEVVLHFGFGTRTEFCYLLQIGLWAGAISTLFQVTIQDSINKFTALNNRLEKEVGELAQEVNGLEATSEQLAEQLTAFDGIRAQMEECAKNSGVEFQELFAKTTSVFSSMTDVQKKQDYALLEKAAADIEFMDNQAGMTLQEFKRFCKTVPTKFREKLSNDIEETFKTVAGEDGIISYDEQKAFFNKILEDCNPQAGEP